MAASRKERSLLFPRSCQTFLNFSSYYSSSFNKNSEYLRSFLLSIFFNDCVASSNFCLTIRNLGLSVKKNRFIDKTSRGNPVKKTIISRQSDIKVNIIPIIIQPSACPIKIKQGVNVRRLSLEISLSKTIVDILKPVMPKFKKNVQI